MHRETDGAGYRDAEDDAAVVVGQAPGQPRAMDDVSGRDGPSSHGAISALAESSGGPVVGSPWPSSTQVVDRDHGRHGRAATALG